MPTINASDLPAAKGSKPIPHIFFVATVLLWIIFALTAWVVIRITIQISPPYDLLAAHRAIMPGQSDVFPAKYNCRTRAAPESLKVEVRYCTVEDPMIRRIVISSSGRTIQQVTISFNDLPIAFLSLGWGQPQSIEYDYQHDNFFYTATWRSYLRARGRVAGHVAGGGTVQILRIGHEQAQPQNAIIALEASD